MSTDRLGTLETNVEAAGATAVRVTEDGLTDAILEAVESPAVATRLEGFDASLEDTPIAVDPTPAEVWDARTGVTTADFAIAEYGSIYLPQAANGSELLSVFVDRHVAVLRAADVEPTMASAFERLGEDLPASRDSGIIATGPSATADMGELVQGAHGPGSVHVIIVTGA